LFLIEVYLLFFRNQLYYDHYNSLKVKKMSEKKFVDLETRLAFMEDTVNTLNEIIYQQQQEIDKLNLRFNTVNKNLSQLQESVTNHADEKPPHY